MTIPPFDTNGNLPVGDLFAAGAPYKCVLKADLASLRARFVDDFPTSPTRRAIWDGWMQLRTEIEKLGVRYRTLVDGSFVSAKVDPNDVDLVTLFDAEEINNLQPQGQASLQALLYARPQIKGVLRCDAYWMVVRPFTDADYHDTLRQLSYWTHVFGHDRAGNQKSFLLVDEMGVI